MTILTYIIPNILIALMLVYGVLQGQKRGWQKSLIKFGYTALLAVGTFFLSNHLIMPGLIKAAGESSELVTMLPTVMWMVVFGVFMFIAEVVYTMVCHQLDIELRENKAALKAARRADITKKSKEVKAEEKMIAKAQRHAFRQHRKEQMQFWLAEHKVSRIFGGIAGFMQYTLISIMVIMLASHTVSLLMMQEEVKEESSEVMVTIDECYDHSVYGLVDNLINKKNEDGTFEDRLLAEELVIIESHLNTNDVE